MTLSQRCVAYASINIYGNTAETDVESLYKLKYKEEMKWINMYVTYAVMFMTLQ